MTTHSEIERLALNELEPKLIRRGYRVIRNPSSAQLPSFIQDYIPDAIAIGVTPNIAIEIKGPDAVETKKNLSKVRELFSGRNDWVFQVYYFKSLEPLLVKLPAEELSEKFEEIEYLAKVNAKAAFVLAWSILEASVREAGMVNDEARGPDRVVSLLASEGYIESGEASDFLELANLRNRIIHGQLNIEPSPDDVERLLTLASTVRATKINHLTPQ